MRFSTIAVSAAAFGATAMAMPGSVVYQTSVVTITSCAPEKTNCPGRSSTSAPAVSSPPPPPVVTPPVVTSPVVTPPVVTPGCPGGPHCPPPPVPSSGYSLPAPVHPNTTYVHPIPSVSKPACSGGYNCPPVVTPVCPGPQCPPATMTNKPIASVIPGTGLPSYVPSGTGVPYPPKNTSLAVPVPSTPPTFTGSGSIQSFSILAVGAAVAAFFL